MTDKDFIIRFLNKNFNVVIGLDEFNIFDKHSNENITKIKFMQIIDKIFGSYFIENETAREIAILWFSDKKDLQLNKLMDYLNNCKIILGNMDWVVLKFDGTEIDEKIFVSEFEHLYPKKIIKQYFNTWRDAMVIDVSQKIMNKYY